MVNGINCQNYQLLIGRKEMVVLRRAQSKTFDVILSLPRPVILSSSKDDPPRRLRICGTVPLRQAQSDSVAQSDTQPVILSSSFPVILSSSKDDLKSKDDSRRRLRVGDPVPLRRAQSDIVAQSDTRPVTLRQAQSDGKSKDDLIERLRLGGPVPLRQAQSDSEVQRDSGAQRDTQYVTLRQAQSDTRPVILSSSKDDLKSKDDPKSKDEKGVLCRKNIAIVV